ERASDKQRTFWLFVSCAMWLFIQSRPIDDMDVFTQVRLGEMMLERAAFVTAEPFSYLHLRQPIGNPGWLAQMLFALLSRAGGWQLLRMTYAFGFALAFIFAARAIGPRRPLNRPVVTAGAAILGFLASLSNSSVRPQGIALLCFAAILYILSVTSL